MRILVIDDTEDNRLVLSDRLTSAGYEVVEATSGEEGIDVAESHPPDLVLMDLRLPGIDGYEAVRRMKASPRLGRIPIIAVTSYALTGDEERARAAGCDGYLAKRIVVVQSR